MELTLVLPLRLLLYLKKNTVRQLNSTSFFQFIFHLQDQIYYLSKELLLLADVADTPDGALVVVVVDALPLGLYLFLFGLSPNVFSKFCFGASSLTATSSCKSSVLGFGDVLRIVG